ncbi:hypothetical protein ACFQY7_02690 [Actinomadura luteofluorescens]|uniref:hypothetical protein n=1 Tax=Actinomadura luteofluorescens TaxID=46163 RepID=UPI00363CA495
MVTVLVLASLVALFGLFLPNLLHPMPPRPAPEQGDPAPEPPRAVPPPPSPPIPRATRSP